MQLQNKRGFFRIPDYFLSFGSLQARILLPNLTIARHICPFESSFNPSAALYGSNGEDIDIDLKQPEASIFSRKTAPLILFSLSVPSGSLSARLLSRAGTLITALYRILPQKVYLKSQSLLSMVSGVTGGGSGKLSPLSLSNASFVIFSVLPPEYASFTSVG